MDATATARETAAVQRLIDELDLNIHVRSDHEDRGAIETLFWTLTITIPATTFLTAFARRVGEHAADASAEAAASAASSLRRWIDRLFKARRGDKGSLVLTDIDRGLDILMPSDLSREAYLQLTQLLEAMPDSAVSCPCELYWTGITWSRRFL